MGLKKVKLPSCSVMSRSESKERVFSTEDLKEKL